MQSALTLSPSHHPRPHPLFFNSPFLSHFPISSPFQHWWSYRAGREVSNDLTEHFSISFPKLSCGPLSSFPACRISFFFFEDQTRCFCRPELKKNSSRHCGTWQHDSGFKRLTRFRSRRISKLCKMKLFLSMTAGCERHSLQNRRSRFYAKRINATSRYGSSLPRRHSCGSTRTPPQ